MQRIRLYLAICLAWLVLAMPAMAVGIAQISGTGTGGAIINTVFNAGTTVSATTTAAIPSGSLIVAVAQGGTVSTMQDFSCSDPTNGTYNAGQAVTTTNGSSTRITYIYSTGLLSSGSTISCTVTSGSGGLIMTVAAFSGSGATPFDSASATGVTCTNCSGVATVGPTGTLNGPCGSANCEVLIGAEVRHASSVVTTDPNFTWLSGTGTIQFALGFKIVSATTAISFSPSFAGTATWAGQLQGFKAASPAGTTNKLLFRSIP